MDDYSEVEIDYIDQYHIYYKNVKLNKYWII